jgi:hypothetical protein
MDKLKKTFSESNGFEQKHFSLEEREIEIFLPPIRSVAMESSFFRRNKK